MKPEKIISVSAILFISVLAGASFYFSEKSPAGSEKNADLASPAAGISGVSEESALPERVFHEVPFTPQAPLGNWEDIREQNGCEEAALLMAVSWAREKTFSPEAAAREIQSMSDYHLRAHGHFHDLSNADTLQLLKEYFHYFDARLVENVSADDIKKELARGRLVIVGVNGVILGNPNYEPPGPKNHKILIVGYDESSREFITHDPGTSRGENYRYGFDLLESSLEDYPTGFHEMFPERKTSMIIVEK